jgi:hypothetical protein
MVTMTSYDSPITTSHLSARLPDNQADSAPKYGASKRSRHQSKPPPRHPVVVNGESLLLRNCGCPGNDVLMFNRRVLNFFCW